MEKDHETKRSQSSFHRQVCGSARSPGFYSGVNTLIKLPNYQANGPQSDFGLLMSHFWTQLLDLCLHSFLYQRLLSGGDRPLIVLHLVSSCRVPDITRVNRQNRESRKGRQREEEEVSSLCANQSHTGSNSAWHR